MILHNVSYSYKIITFTTIRGSAATLIICIITKTWIGYNVINITNYLFSDSHTILNELTQKMLVFRLEILKQKFKIASLL